MRVEDADQGALEQLGVVVVGGVLRDAEPDLDEVTNAWPALTAATAARPTAVMTASNGALFVGFVGLGEVVDEDAARRRPCIASTV